MPCGCFGKKKRIRNSSPQPTPTITVTKAGDAIKNTPEQEKKLFNGTEQKEKESKKTISKTETHRENSSDVDSKPETEVNLQLDFIEKIIEAHNDKRKLHGCEPVTHAKDLSEFAQKYAEYLLKNNKFEHSKDRGHMVGENLAAATGMDLTGEAATDMWYDEIKDYNFHKQGFTMGTGHFTQVVWKDTKEVGVGKAWNPTTKEVIVCANYRPAGNVQGRFEDNVFPPQE